MAFLGVVCAERPAAADQEKTVQWNEAWPRVSLWEVGDVVALTAGSVLINAAPSHATAQWQGPILFDKYIRDALKGRTRAAQLTAADLSDVFYKGMVITPYIVDNYIAALGVHQNADVALQMTVIDMQSLGLSGVLTLAAEHAVGRQRPYVSGCLGPDKTDKIGFNACGGADDFKSFYSGHAAAMFTMAGLTCVHHQHLPLYGGGLPDALACVFMVTAASTGSLMRIIADRHWGSDVMVGTAVGVFNGYFLPAWLHYGLGWNKPAVTTSVQTAFGTIVPVPQFYEGGAGLAISVF